MIEAPLVRKDSGDFRIECLVYYAERLFKCEYKVTKSGDVEMIYGDQVEVDDLPAVH
jgi:hypothetical protein